MVTPLFADNLVTSRAVNKLLLSYAAHGKGSSEGLLFKLKNLSRQDIGESRKDHNLWVCPTRFLTVKALSTRRRFVVTSIGDRIV